MRTTATLDPDVERVVRRRMREHNETFTQALNDLIRASAGSHSPRQWFQTETASMGIPDIGLDRATQEVAEVEDEELIGKMRAR